MVASIARKDPAAWTKIYWPCALAAAVLGYLAVDLFASQYRGAALAAGAALIIVPELTVLILHRDTDTFSDWCWRVLDVTRNQPLSQWGASHLLAVLLYVLVCVRVLTFMWEHSGYWLAGAATAVALWLLRHLFWGWWR